jgi:hypothetical protein
LPDFVNNFFNELKILCISRELRTPASVAWRLGKPSFKVQVQRRLAVRLVAGAQAFLLAGRRILGIMDSAAPKRGVVSSV